MVGIPGKSKGCHTCRKRKIGCDQGRPFCGQCRKSGRVCGGYDRKTVFLNQFAGEFQPKKQYLDFRQSDQGTSSNALIRQRDVHESQIATDDGSVVDRHPSVIVKPHVPRLIGFEHLQSDQALKTFLSYSLPQHAKEEVPLSWLYSILDVVKDSRALLLAVSALSYGWAGHVDELPKLVGEARSLYVGALQTLHEHLKDDPASQSDATLAAMQCLALYEIFEFGTESETGWLAHLAGVETIIRLRGPQMHIAGFGNQMFMFFRTIGVFKALICRKAIFLSDVQWRHTPWTLHPKNTFHRAFDLMSEVPALLERADKLSMITTSNDKENNNTTTIAQQNLLLDYLHDCTSLLHKLDELDTKLGIKLPAGPPTISTPLASSPPPSTIIPPPQSQQRQTSEYIYSQLARHQTAYAPPPRRHNYPSKTPQLLGTPFDTLQTTRLVHCIWTVQLQLFLSVYTSPPLLSQLAALPLFNHRHQSTSVSPTPLTRPHGTKLAGHVSRWADYATQSAWQSFGPVIALFSLRTAVQWFRLDREYERGLFGEQRESAGRRTTTATATMSEPADSFGYDFCYRYQPELDKCLALLRGIAGDG